LPSLEELVSCCLLKSSCCAGSYLVTGQYLNRHASADITQVGQELVDGENYKSADEEEKEDVYDAEEYWPHHRRYHDYDDSYYDPDVLASEQAKQKYELKAEAWSAPQPRISRVL
jgi:hypothetical protein